MSFSATIGKFNQKALKASSDFKRAVGIELFSSVISDTPVDTGRARGNWQITLNTPAKGVTSNSQDAAKNAVLIPVNYGKLEDTNYLTNNLPYIGKLEYDGHSQQAPDGMVRKNIARVNSIISSKLNEHKI